MSGSMALAAARRRRVNVIEQPPVQQRQTTQPVQTNDNKTLVTPLTIMKQHHNDILSIKEDIKNIKNITGSFNYEEGYNNLLKEVMEMKKTIVKLQSFIMDTDSELKKLKETKNNIVVEEDDEDDLSTTD